MTNKALLNYYVRLINKEALTMEDVPDDLREDVQRLLNNNDTSDSKEEGPVYEEPEEENHKLGAKVISNKNIGTDPKKFMENKEIQLALLITEILTNDVIPQEEEYPQNIDFEVVRVEDFWGRYVDIPRVYTEYDQEYCILRIKVKAEPNIYFKPGDEMMRIDLKMTSDNYEDMTMTIYINAAEE